MRLLQDRGPEGGISDTILKAIELGQKSPHGSGWFFKNFVVPFSKVPLRIPSQQFARIPVLGFPVYIKMYKNYFGKDKNGVPNNKHPLEGVSNEIVGQFNTMILMTLLYSLVDCDDEKTKITGAARSFDRSGRKFRYEKGVKEGQTIEIGDTDYSYDKVDPAAGVIATAVDFVRALKCDGSLPEGVNSMFKSVWGQAKSKTYGKSVTNLLRLGEEDYDLSDYAASTIGSWVPQQAQQYLRGQREDDNIGYTRSGTTMEKVGKRTQLMESFPIFSPFGFKAKDTRGVTGFKTKSNIIYKGNRVFERYNNKYQPETKAYPIAAVPSYYVDKVTVTMPDKTFSEYSRLSGELARRVTDEMLPDHMAGDPDSVTLKLVRKAISGGKELIKNHLNANQEAFETGEIDVDMDDLELDLKRMVRKATQSKPTKPKKTGQSEAVFNEQEDIYEEAKAARTRYNEWYWDNIGKIMK